MSLDRATVLRIAHLARLDIPDNRLEPLAGELNNILSWVEQLNAVDTGDVPPMTAVVPMRLRRRADVVTEGGQADAILANAPQTERDCFVVPKVIE